MSSVLQARLTSAASRVLPSRVKRRLKSLVRAYDQIFRAFTPADLRGALRPLVSLAEGLRRTWAWFERRPPAPVPRCEGRAGVPAL